MGAGSAAGLAGTAPGFAGLDADAAAALGRGEAHVVDGALGGEAARALASALAERDGRLAHAALGRSRAIVPEVRGDRIEWLERDPLPPFAPLWTLFDRLADDLRARAWLGPLEIEVQHAVFPAGAGYAPHRDAFTGGGRRRATAVWYANPGWTPGDGGELRLLEPAGARDVAPVLDRLVVFLADRVEHAVLRCGAPRRAVTAWFLGPPAR